MNDNNGINQGSSLLRFFSKPAVGIAGSIASIIGILLSVYFFQASREKSKLTYFVHPAKAAVVRTQQTSRLAVQYDGQGLKSDITAAQVAFWNAGSKPIRANDVLSPLVIQTGNKERILEASLRKTSRDVVGITLDPSRVAAGEVEIRWTILEQNDGGVLQIIFAGDETVDIQAHAILEGQPAIVELEYSGELRTPGEQYARRQGLKAQFPAYLIIVVGLFMIPVTVWLLARKQKRGQKLRPSDWFMLVQGPFLIAVGIWTLMTQRPPGPPFGF